MNMIDMATAAWSSDRCMIEFGINRISLSSPAPANASSVGFRPEHCLRQPTGGDEMSIGMSGANLITIENLGDRAFQYMSTGYGEITVISTENDQDSALPDPIYVPVGRLHFFDTAGNRI